MKAKILAVVEQKYGNEGKKLYKVVADNDKEYTCFSERIKDMKGQEVEFEEVQGKEYNGERPWIMNLPKEGGSGGGFQGKGGFRPAGKSPEEIETNKRTMIMSYAKDIGIKMYEKSDGKLSVTDVMDNVCEAYNRMMFVVNGPVEKTTVDPFQEII